MISRIGSRGYTESASRVQKAGTGPAEARAPKTNTREPTTEAAAVVRIGSAARALASEASGAERTRIDTEQRAEISIEPVVAQPVPDFNAPKAGPIGSNDEATSNERPAPTNEPQAAANERQAPTNGTRFEA
jgi:hypothetical protein